jgi:hypothetical protein
VANLKFSGEILDDILTRAGELNDGTSDFHVQALIYLNRAAKAIYRGGGEIDKDIHEDWLWQKQTATLILEPKITAGSVIVTRNSNIITFSSPPAASVAGWFFKTDIHSDWFKILTHTAASATATLDSVYTGQNGSGLAFKLIKLEYDLAVDFLRPFAPFYMSVPPMQFPSDDYKINGVELTELKSMYPLTIVAEGAPAAFAMCGQKKVRFSGYPADLLRVEYDYLYLPADLTDSPSEEPIIPYEDRHILSDLALLFLLDEKEDSRAAGMGQLAKSDLQAMANANRKRMLQIGRSFAKIYPRQGQLVRPGPRGYR